MATIYGFVAEWFDEVARISKQFLLKLFVHSNEIEIYDMKFNKCFLRRSPLPLNLKSSDFFLGAKVLVYSRLMTIIDFGDPFTRRHLAPSTDSSAILLGPDCNKKIGKIFADILSAGMKIIDIQSILLEESELCEIFHIIGAIAPLDQLLKFWRSGMSVILRVEAENCSQTVVQAVEGIRSRYRANEIESAAWYGDGLFEFFFDGDRTFPTTAKLERCTCGIIRPHSTKNGDFAMIIDNIISSGFFITALKMLELNQTSASEFLEVYDGVMPNFTDMVTYMCTGPIIVLEITTKEPDVVSKFRDFVGPWDVEMAKELRPDTIRAKFGKNRTENAIHCTDLAEDGIPECAYFFDILHQQ
jgi:nucleoside-diphosphate kinase